jgi:hypothetical protein
LLRTGYEQIKGTCEHCKREIERERYNKLTLEQKQARGKKANKQAQKRRDKALAYIERQAKILDKQNDRIERLEQKVEKAVRYRVLYQENGDMYVDFVPFRMWLLRMNRESGYNTVEIAAKIGVNESRVRHWLDGYEWKGTGRDPNAMRSIKLETVDKVAIALGDPGLVERLYPLELE